MRKSDLIRLSLVIILTLCFFGGTGCATRSDRSWGILGGALLTPSGIAHTAATIGGWKIVTAPDGEEVSVFPMHGMSVQPTMAEVARLQRAGDGFLLLYVDGEMAPVDNLIDYVEVVPGFKRLILAPGSDRMFSYEMAEQSYTLVLDTKPGAWYIFRTRILEEGTKMEPVVHGTMRKTKRQVTLAPFEVIEILNGASTTVATTHDFIPLSTE